MTLRLKLILPCLVVGSCFAGMVLAQETAPDSPREAGVATHVTATDSSGNEPESSSEFPTWKNTSEESGHLVTEDISDFTILLPNVIPLDRGSIGQPAPLLLRGGSPQQTAVSVNSFVLYEPIFGFLDTSSLPVALTEEVAFSEATTEVPPGFSGLGNLDTRRFREGHPYSRVHFRTGDWGYSDLGITFGLPVSNATHLTFTGNREEFDGFLGERRNLVNSRFFGTFRFEPNAGLAINAVVMSNRNKVEVPAPLLPDLIPHLAQPRRKTTRFDSGIELRLGNLTNRKREFRSSLFFSRDRIESINDSLIFDNRAISIGGTMQGRFAFGEQVLALGGGFRLHDLDSENMENRTDDFGYVFAAQRYNISPWVGLSVRGTLEKHEDYDPQFSPSARLDFVLAENNRVWLAASNRRRYPSFSERLWQSEFFRGNPQIEPETSRAGEVGLQAQLGDSRLQAAAFIRNVSDWIGTVFTAGDTTTPNVQNLGDRTVTGVEFRLQQAYARGGQVGVVGTYLNVDQVDSEKQLQVPEYVLYPYVEYGLALFERSVYVRLRVNGRIFGERAGLFYEQGATVPKYVTRSADRLFDATLALIFAGPTVKLSVDNIFDRVYELVPGFSMPPRTLRFEIAWSFWD